jgi:hypothetical protein
MMVSTLNVVPDCRAIVPKPAREQFIAAIFFDAWMMGLPLIRPRRRRGQGRNRISAGARREVLERDGERCVLCGRVPDTLSLDHVIPLIYGGSNAPANLQPACVGCNAADFGKRFGSLWHARQAEAPADWRTIT